MFANYHSHTFRCHHAVGTQRQYIEAAIAAGYKQFGFSDHTPYPFDNGYVSSIRMLPEELEGYVKETLDLREAYKADIDIKLGLEVECFPQHFEAWMKLVEQYPFDYFLLAQHYTHNDYDGVYVGTPTDDESVLAAYCQQIEMGLDSGKFLYVAHPDLVNFTGSQEVYDRYMRQLCRTVKRHGLPLEINLLGIKAKRNYPNPLFWRMAGEEQVDVVIGVDAHRPDTVSLPECEAVAHKLIADNHLHLLERLL